MHPSTTPFGHDYQGMSDHAPDYNRLDGPVQPRSQVRPLRSPQGDHQEDGAGPRRPFRTPSYSPEPFRKWKDDSSRSRSRFQGCLGTRPEDSQGRTSRSQVKQQGHDSGSRGRPRGRSKSPYRGQRSNSKYRERSGSSRRDDSRNRRRARSLSSNSSRTSRSRSRLHTSTKNKSRYQIKDRKTGKKIECGSEYGDTSDMFGDDLAYHHKTADVVSVPLCEFALDQHGQIEQGVCAVIPGQNQYQRACPFRLTQREARIQVGWIGRCSNKSRLLKIPRAERPKYVGMCTKGNPEGPSGNDSPHVQLEVVRPGRRTPKLEATTHIDAGETIRVKLRKNYKYWGRLEVPSFMELSILHRFLTTIPADNRRNSSRNGIGCRPAGSSSDPYGFYER
jgi:hypothetical protein